MQTEELNVVKRNGTIETVSFDKILNRIKKIGAEVHLKINYTTLAMKVIEQLYNNISTTKIDELSAEQCASMASIHPDYNILAGRIVVSNHHKNTTKSFSDVMRQLYNYRDKHDKHSPLISKELHDVVRKNAKILDQLCDYNRDYLIDYFGFKTLERAYLMRINGRIVERTQHMWMRVSLGIHGADIESARETYTYMSQKYFTHATPTLFNAGTPHSQLSSCYLLAMESDSIEGIYNTLKDCALISKWAGGIGLHMHNVRGSGSHIRGTNGTSNGLVPMLRVFNNTAKYVDQCLVGETKVYSRDKGMIPISDVVEGETSVYGFPIKDTGDDFSHEEFNRMNEIKSIETDGLNITLSKTSTVEADEDKTAGFNRVKRVLKHDYSGNIISIKTLDDRQQTEKTMRLTGQHPMLCVRRENYAAYYSNLMNSTDEDLKQWKYAEWVEAGKLECGDWLLYSLLMAREIVGIETEHFEGEVYDLEMENSPNYLTEGGIVHNGGGKRNGSFAIYLEPWHSDIDLFLNMRKNHGDEELRARDLFYALWIPDLFMERVKTNGKWTLMCPDECPGLADVYGDQFVELYESYERAGKGRKTVNARDLWFQVLDAQMETGTPYLCYKDAANKKSNQKNIGTIKSSNLCVSGDTLILTSKGQIPIRSLEGKRVEVWNGVEWSEVSIFKTGINKPVINVRISPDSTSDEFCVLKCTPSHKFYVYNEHGVALPCNAQDLRLGMHLIDLNLRETAWANMSYTDARVIGLEDLGETCDTFCFTEPKKHMGVFNGILTGQCTEIMEYSDEKETAVCNLASVALPMYVNQATREFDYVKLHDVVKVMTRNLDRIIDINYYPIEKTHRSNMRHRPIGLGVQGLADAFILMGLSFHSEEAREVNRLIFETIYHAALEQSCAISREREAYYSEHGLPHKLKTKEQLPFGISPLNEYDLHYFSTFMDASGTPDRPLKWIGAYSTFAGSPTSEGILQFDMWNVAPTDRRYDWTGLKADIIRYGIRNSLLVAPMPTASTSQILGFNECIEPLTSNIYSRKTLAGEFILANKYLMMDLLELGLWTDKMKNNIIQHSGSIQHLEEIPVEIRNKYKTVWEIPMKHLIDMAADRGAYICQSQSLNLWISDPNYNLLTSMHFYSWSKGLKTGIYYLRRRAKHQAQKFTIEPEKASHGKSEEVEECLNCSA